MIGTCKRSELDERSRCRDSMKFCFMAEISIVIDIESLTLKLRSVLRQYVGCVAGRNPILPYVVMYICLYGSVGGQHSRSHPKKRRLDTVHSSSRDDLSLSEISQATED